MRILVQKFGGTSVRNLECQQSVMAKVKSGLERGDKVIVVLSAMAGETDRLLEMARQWTPRPDLAEMDVLVSTGEQVSVALFAMLLKDNGIKARSMLGFQADMRTTCAHAKARILSIDEQRLRDYLDKYDVLVMAGFQGWTEDCRITTLGRGGSDTSAVALAAALGGAPKNVECEIYTDVDGVYTTDPNMCSKAQKLDKISYDMMLEFAGMGAKVLQIRSVEFAKKYDVPVHVRSTFTDDPGTLVTKEDPDMEAVMVSGIAYDKDQARITLHNVPDHPGVAAALFGPLADAGILVDMIIQNAGQAEKTDITFTIPRADLEATLEILQVANREIEAEEILHDLHVCKVSAIGVGMRSHSGVAAKAFQALKDENINILMISTSEIKITCLIEEKYTELAVRTLHKAFGLDKAD